MRKPHTRIDGVAPKRDKKRPPVGPLPLSARYISGSQAVVCCNLPSNKYHDQTQLRPSLKEKLSILDPSLSRIPSRNISQNLSRNVLPDFSLADLSLADFSLSSDSSVDFSAYLPTLSERLERKPPKWIRTRSLQSHITNFRHSGNMAWNFTYLLMITTLRKPKPAVRSCTPTSIIWFLVYSSESTMNCDRKPSIWFATAAGSITVPIKPRSLSTWLIWSSGTCVKRFAWPGHTIPQWPWSEYCRLTGSGSDDPAMAYEELLMVRVMLERVNADSDSDSYTVRSGTDNTSTAGTVFSGTRTANTVSSRARTANTVSSRTRTAGTVSSGTRTAGTVFSGTRAANTVSSGTRPVNSVFSGTRTANTVSDTRTVNTVTTYPSSTQNANAVPYNTRPETFSFTFAAEGENAFVGIAQHMAGPSHSRSVELSMRYTSGEIPPGRDLVRRNPSRRNPSRNLSGPWVFPDIYKNDDVGWRNLDSDIYEDDLDVGWRTRD
ncbi:protein with DEXDc plus ring plus HELICc [Ilyonectria robusta]